MTRTAGYLHCEPDPVFVLLDEPEGPMREVAILLVPPFGWDEACSYRGRRRWARSLAGLGYPTARLDLPGSGNSSGDPRDPERLASWSEAVGATSAWLRERTGCSRVVALGVGLGGVTAYLAAAGGAQIDDLILWNVPAKGRTLVRALRAYSAVVPGGAGEAAGSSWSSEGCLELTGFSMSTATAEFLCGLDLATVALPEAERRRVLLIGRDGQEPDARLQAHLQASGAEVAVSPGEDYGDLMTAPQQSRPPETTIAATASWLDLTPASSEPLRAPASGSLDFSLHLVLPGGAIRERPVRIPLEGGFAFGVLTEPAQPDPGALCVVLLNSGALRHTGPNRSWVDLARRWAAGGNKVLRVDLIGIGEADGEDFSLLSNDALYDDRRIAETMAIMDWLQEHQISRRFVLCGLCSGAYWALHGALADPRVVGTFLINLYAFRWSHSLLREQEAGETLTKIRRRGLYRARHLKLTPAEAIAILKNLNPARFRVGASRPAELEQNQQFDHALDSLRQRSTEVLLLLSRGEAFGEQLARRKHLDIPRRWPNVRWEEIPSDDHLFRALWLQQHVSEILDAALDRVHARSCEGLQTSPPPPPTPAPAASRG